MLEIKVQSVGEHVVVNPGRFKIGKKENPEFKFKNTCGGVIQVMFLQTKLLTLNGSPVSANKFLTPAVDNGASSGVFKLAAGANLGEYDYVIKFDSDGWTEEARETRPGAEFGVAIGGSSPRIIVRSSVPL